MNTLLLVRTLGRTYYRQNAGLLAFLFFIMVIAVGRANDVGLLEYHYSLILGTLTSPSFLVVVLAAWLVYALKCLRFVQTILRRREYSFLYQISLADRPAAFLQLVVVQLLLFLPVWSYALIMLGVGYHRHLYLSTTIVLLFNLSVCLLSAAWYLYLLRHPDIAGRGGRWRILSFAGRKPYLSFLIRYTLTVRPVLFLAIKLYSCGTLYLMVAGSFNGEYDRRMVLLFYSFGLLGHGVLIHRLKEMEKTRLSFYRGLPFSLSARFIQYAAFYFLLFLPEFITILALAGMYLTWGDTALLLAFGHSILLLLNSLLLFPFPRMMDYLKIIGCIFFLIFLAVLTGILPWLCLFFFAFSIGIFFKRYDTFDNFA